MIMRRRSSALSEILWYLNPFHIQINSFTMWLFVILLPFGYYAWTFIPPILEDGMGWGMIILLGIYVIGSNMKDVLTIFGCLWVIKNDEDAIGIANTKIDNLLLGTSNTYTPKGGYQIFKKFPIRYAIFPETEEEKALFRAYKINWYEMTSKRKYLYKIMTQGDDNSMVRNVGIRRFEKNGYNKNWQSNEVITTDRYLTDVSM